MTDNTPIGELRESGLTQAQAQKIPTNTGWSNAGLRRRPIGRWTFQLTAGSNGPANTYDLTVASASILIAPVQATGVVNTDAASFATAVNANSAASGFYATVSTDTVTIRQRRSGAKTLVKVVTGDATATLVAAFASSDTWTEIVSGTAMDGDEYYELGWSGALVIDTAGGVDLTNARLTELDLYGSDQAFQLWSGKGVQTSANVILAGQPVAAATWESNLPWMDASMPLTIKFAADVTTFKYRTKFI